MSEDKLELIIGGTSHYYTLVKEPESHKFSLCGPNGEDIIIYLRNWDDVLMTLDRDK
jgi:hypothetical protein